MTAQATSGRNISFRRCYYTHSSTPCPHASFSLCPLLTPPRRWSIHHLPQPRRPDPVQLHLHSWQVHTGAFASGRVITCSLSLLPGVSLITFCLARRTEHEQLLTRQGWLNLTWTRFCCLILFLDSWFFLAFCPYSALSFFVSSIH